MKKNTRSLLTTALILFCAGFLLTIGSLIYATITKVEVYDVEKKDRVIETRSLTIDDVLKNSPDSNYIKQLSSTKYTRIDLTSFTGDVVFSVGGQQTEITLEEANTNNLKYYVEGDALIIKDVDPVGFMGFYIDGSGISFKGLRHIFRPGNAFNSDKTITVKIPEGLTLDLIDVRSSVGDITLDGVSASSINVDSGKGLVTLKNLSNPNAKISVKGNFSDIEMEENLYFNCSATTHFGSISASLVEDAKASTILDLWYGNIDLETVLPTSLYKLSITTANGYVKHNEEDLGKSLNHDGSSAARISSSIVMGNFNMSYVGEKEDHFVPSQIAPPTSSSTITTDETASSNNAEQK